MTSRQVGVSDSAGILTQPIVEDLKGNLIFLKEVWNYHSTNPMSLLGLRVVEDGNLDSHPIMCMSLKENLDFYPT